MHIEPGQIELTTNANGLSDIKPGELLEAKEVMSFRKICAAPEKVTARSICSRKAR